MNGFPAPVVASAGSIDPAAPLVVLLHGRGSHEREILGLGGHLPAAGRYRRVQRRRGVRPAACCSTTPGRYAGTAILYGTLPFDAGVPTTPAASAAFLSS